VWVACAVFAAAFGWRLWRDPRTFRAGLYMVAAVGCAMAAVGGAWLRGMERQHPVAAAGWVWALVWVLAATVALLAVALIANGLVTMRREGVSPAHSLSAAGGVGLAGLLAVWGWALGSGAVRPALILFDVMAAASYLGVGLAAYLTYGPVYRLISRTMAPPPSAVVVLGAGLGPGGRVTPLLAARLERGLGVARGWGVPVVASGGRGVDEPVAEGVAMAEYLVARGVPEGRVLVEDRSRSTAQNLAFSAELLRARGLDGPVVVVTSNYHVLRAAMEMRRLGIPGRAVGARVASYFWPSAALREYVAICWGHRRAWVAGLVATCLPVVALSIWLWGR
jgi:uncharacterized SAM-binding protein YcdF (DUF218 family)